MAADKGGVEQQKLEARGTAAFSHSSLHLKILQLSAKSAAKEGPPPPAAAGSTPSSAPSSSVVVIAKAAPPSVCTKAIFSQGPSINQASTSGKAVMLGVPRPPPPQPANLQIPPAGLRSAPPLGSAHLACPAGTLLIRSESGQLMLVSQQGSAPTPRVMAQQVVGGGGRGGSRGFSVVEGEKLPVGVCHPGLCRRRPEEQ